MAIVWMRRGGWPLTTTYLRLEDPDDAQLELWADRGFRPLSEEAAALQEAAWQEADDE